MDEHQSMSHEEVDLQQLLHTELLIKPEPATDYSVEQLGGYEPVGFEELSMPPLKVEVEGDTNSAYDSFDQIGEFSDASSSAAPPPVDIDVHKASVKQEDVDLRELMHTMYIIKDEARVDCPDLVSLAQYDEATASIPTVGHAASSTLHHCDELGEHHHRGAHTGSKQYKCNICHKMFSHTGYFKQHQRFHSGEKPYRCTFCSKTFNTSGNLKTHILIHTGERPYRCTVCNKTFSTNGNLKTHGLTHTGEKPYQCKICAKTFSTNGNLKIHVLTHTDRKRFQCKRCNKVFRYSNNLKAHEKVHLKE